MSSLVSIQSLEAQQIADLQFENLIERGESDEWKISIALLDKWSSALVYNCGMSRLVMTRLEWGLW